MTAAGGRRPPLAMLIPTFSRRPALEGLLRLLAADPAIRAARIPVLVADNHSSDNTVVAVRALMAECPELDLRLHEHPENIGMTANFRWLIEHAPPAEYVWLFGDDDRPTEGIVGDVLAAAQAGAGLIHLPCRFEDDGRAIQGGASPCPAALETYPGSAELYLTDYWLHFVSGTVVRQADLVQAVRLAPTDNEWGPYIWSAVAARDAPCIVLPRVGVIGDPNHGWLSERVTLLSRRVIESFDDGLALVVDHAGFTRMLDVRYQPRWGHDNAWLSAPLDELLAAVARFPASRELRRLLATRGRDEASRDAIAAAAAAARCSGAADRATAAIARGEARFVEGELEQAVQQFELALAEDGTSALAWCNLGVVHQAQAGAAFDAALSVDPDHVQALLQRMLWHVAGGRQADADRDARRVAEIDSASASGDGAQILPAST